MRAIVIYESLYGNTHAIAEAIAAGLAEFARVELLPVSHAHEQELADVDLVVVGGPTHVHGMSRGATRKAAVAATEQPDSPLELDPDAAGEGVREWLGGLRGARGLAAAFDTRVDAPVLVTGHASKGILKALKHAGLEPIAEPESFLVTEDTHLLPGETERARSWGRGLAEQAGAGRARA